MAATPWAPVSIQLRALPALMPPIATTGNATASQTSASRASPCGGPNARFDGESVQFETPAFGVSPGQAAVLYAGDQVLGGGWIAETVPAELITA